MEKMHEGALAQEIVRVVEQHLAGYKRAGQAGRQIGRVSRVNVAVGELAAVVPDSLRFWFEALVKGTPLEEAELAIHEVPVCARCSDCGSTFEISGPDFRCPTCGPARVEITSGRELLIESIELADNGLDDDSPDNISKEKRRRLNGNQGTKESS